MALSLEFDASSVKSRVRQGIIECDATYHLFVCWLWLAQVFYIFIYKFLFVNFLCTFSNRWCFFVLGAPPICFESQVQKCHVFVQRDSNRDQLETFDWTREGLIRAFIHASHKTKTNFTHYSTLFATLHCTLHSARRIRSKSSSPLPFPVTTWYLRYSTIPICPAVIECETAESLLEAIYRKHPVSFWSFLFSQSGILGSGPCWRTFLMICHQNFRKEQ